MNPLAFLLAGLLALASCSPQSPQEPPAPPRDVSFFHGAFLIPGDGNPIEKSAMIVENGKIVEIGKESEVRAPNGAAHIDLTGKTIMPTMTNLHGHVGYLKGLSYAARNYTRDSIVDALNRYLYYGVGAVLVLGSDVGNIAFELREDQRQDKVGGAIFFTAGRGFTGKNGFPTTIPALEDAPYQVATADEARTAVQELAAKKVDMIKLWVDDNMGRVPKLKPEVYRAIIDEAHKHNIRVMSHLFYLADAKDLVQSGLDGIAHSVRDREVDDELISLLKEKNVFVVPTLAGHESAFIYAERPPWIGEPSMRESMPSQVLAQLSSDQFVESFKKNPDLKKFQQQFQVAQRNLKKLNDAGVTIAFGTDSGASNRFPGYFEHRELELMVRAGMTPAQAITAATKTSAEILGVGELGTLAPGKSADFVVLDANPLENIANSRQIDKVYRKGKELDRSPMMIRFTSSLQ